MFFVDSHIYVLTKYGVEVSGTQSVTLTVFVRSQNCVGDGQSVRNAGPVRPVMQHNVVLMDGI